MCVYWRAGPKLWFCGSYVKIGEELAPEMTQEWGHLKFWHDHESLWRRRHACEGLFARINGGSATLILSLSFWMATVSSMTLSSSVRANTLISLFLTFRKILIGCRLVCTRFNYTCRSRGVSRHFLALRRFHGNNSGPLAMIGILAYCFAQKLLQCAESVYYYYSSVRPAVDTNFRVVNHFLQILKRIYL